MCTKFAYDAYKEREKNMETTKEIKKFNGKQYMTINAIAEASGIARDSLTNRFYRFKKEYPEHTCHFGSKIPVYYDEYVLHLLVESTRIRPIRVIENMDKYEKFYKTYKSKAYEVADAEQADFTLVEIAPIDKAVKKNKKKHDSKTEQKVINSREEALSKLVQKQFTRWQVLLQISQNLSQLRFQILHLNVSAMLRMFLLVDMFWLFKRILSGFSFLCFLQKFILKIRNKVLQLMLQG